jgi:hypothetical protein
MVLYKGCRFLVGKAFVRILHISWAKEELSAVLFAYDGESGIIIFPINRGRERGQSPRTQK